MPYAEPLLTYRYQSEDSFFPASDQAIEWSRGKLRRNEHWRMKIRWRQEISKNARVKPKVYLETSFISYLTERLSTDLTSLQRQLSSQPWWAAERERFDLFISQPVYDECGRGDQMVARDRLILIARIPLLPLNEQIMEIAQLLISPGAFPQRLGPMPFTLQSPPHTVASMS